ncbi:MAG: sulfotransferase domain-containing protein [Anaerolineales bacterium]
MTELKRPTTIEEMHKTMENFSTEEGWQRGLAYKPNPTDVFIVTPPKCGTTWMQQILHGRCTRLNGRCYISRSSYGLIWHMIWAMDIHAPAGCPAVRSRPTPL